VSAGRPWKLVAPWYRWPLAADGTVGEGRSSRPAIQKYDDSKLVDAFLADPQHSLRYGPQDLVQQLVPLTGTVPSGPMAGKRLTMATIGTAPTDTRKLFLATHKRFYLVACQLHCDAPGFPRAATGDVCEAGMVVRRRSISYEEAAEDEASAILKRITALQVQLAGLERPGRRERRRRRRRGSANGNGNLPTGPDREQLLADAASARLELHGWASSAGVEWVYEGWIPSGLEGIGSWQPVEEEPAQIVEQVTPMFPLVPDPREPSHAGHHGTIYFGLLPTASADADQFGGARFDDEALYDVRCFVRRHRPECPRTGDPDDCGGELFWSRPTEPYKLAPPFDLEGTANRPVTIQMPDMKMLAAQAFSKPPGAASPVKVISPPESMPTKAGFSIQVPITCFWSIPLITIVAYFLLNLFLGIVVLLFGLWWMLVLKFCSLPPFAIDAQISAQLSAHVDLDLDISVNAQIGVDVAGIHATLMAALDAQLGTVDPPHDDYSGFSKPSEQLDDVSNQAIAAFSQQLASPPSTGPDFAASLEWEPHVEFEAVVSS
jgi:hypothetical protein